MRVGPLWMVLYLLNYVGAKVIGTRNEEERKSEEEGGSASTGSMLETNLPIIRQINKINDDGTYTYGYESADGNFKIETRDVLGNVKGMFGFLDETGKLKRVSYTANNSTGFRPSDMTLYHHSSFITGAPYATDRSTVGIPPVLLLKNAAPSAGAASSPKGAVIQHIPKKIQEEVEESTESGSSSTTSNTISKDDASTSTYREYVVNKRPQNRQEGENIPAYPLRKVLVSKRLLLEEQEEGTGRAGRKESSRSQKNRIDLRRQLHQRAMDYSLDSGHLHENRDSEGRYSYSEGLPPHLNQLMSELRSSIQQPRPSYVSALHPYLQEENDNQNTDSRELQEQDEEDYKITATTSAEMPVTQASYHSKTRIAKLARDQQEPPYVAENDEEEVSYRSQYPRPAPVEPFIPLPALYNTYPPVMIGLPLSLRDEILNIVFNYLQARFGPPPAVPLRPYALPGYSLFLPNSQYNTISQLPSYPFRNNNVRYSSLSTDSIYSLPIHNQIPGRPAPPNILQVAARAQIPYTPLNVVNEISSAPIYRGVHDVPSHNARTSPHDQIRLLRTLGPFIPPTVVPTTASRIRSTPTIAAHQRTRNVQIITEDSTDEMPASGASSSSESN